MVWSRWTLGPMLTFVLTTRTSEVVQCEVVVPFIFFHMWVCGRGFLSLFPGKEKSQKVCLDPIEPSVSEREVGRGQYHIIGLPIPRVYHSVNSTSFRYTSGMAVSIRGARWSNPAEHKMWKRILQCSSRFLSYARKVLIVRMDRIEAAL